MIQRIYIDTSIVGGYFDEEFSEVTKDLFKRLENKEIIFIVSDLLELELTRAPQNVRELLYNFSADQDAEACPSSISANVSVFLLIPPIISM